MKRVLFLCTGNYYRSRFAEILFNHEAQRRELAWQADSSGLDPDPLNPGPISRHTRAALEKMGISCPTFDRWPRTTAAADFVGVDHIVAVKRAEHEPLIASKFPDRIDQIEFWNVHDLDCAGPDEAIPSLRSLVENLLHRLACDAD